MLVWPLSFIPNGDHRKIGKVTHLCLHARLITSPWARGRD